MIYQTGAEFRSARDKRVMLFGMSGLGKTYLAKPGDPAKGGVPFAEYQRRQAQHATAEVSAMLDTTRFIARAQDIYGYDSFVCDTSGSICEVVNADDRADPVMTELSQHLL